MFCRFSVSDDDKNNNYHNYNYQTRCQEKLFDLLNHLISYLMIKGHLAWSHFPCMQHLSRPGRRLGPPPASSPTSLSKYQPARSNTGKSLTLIPYLRLKSQQRILIDCDLISKNANLIFKAGGGKVWVWWTLGQVQEGTSWAAQLVLPNISWQRFGES